MIFTPFTRVISLTIAALVVATVLVSALISAPSIGAQEGLGCADGFVPSDDGVGCVSEPDGAFNDNVTTSASCVQGVLSDDGTQCLIPRLDAAPAAPTAAASGASSTVAIPAQAFTG